MHPPFYLSCRNGFVHVAVVENKSLYTCRLPLAATMAAVKPDDDICLEMAAEGGGVVQLFTDIDRLLLAMSSNQKVC